MHEFLHVVGNVLLWTAIVLAVGLVIGWVTDLVTAVKRWGLACLIRAEAERKRVDIEEFESREFECMDVDNE